MQSAALPPAGTAINSMRRDDPWLKTRNTTKRSPLARYTLYRQIYEKFSFPMRRREQNGRILRHSRAMSGSAGLSPSRNRKQEGSTLSGYARNSRKECAGLVAGPAALTAEIPTLSARHPHVPHRSLLILVKTMPKKNATAAAATSSDRQQVIICDFEDC